MLKNPVRIEVTLMLFVFLRTFFSESLPHLSIFPADTLCISTLKNFRYSLPLQDDQAYMGIYPSQTSTDLSRAL